MKVPAVVQLTGLTGALMRKSLSASLLLGASFVLPPGFARAQTGPATSTPETAGPNEKAAENDDEDSVVVTGRAPRGSVIGDIPPVDVLHTRDVRATGATNFDELLEAVAPEIGAAADSTSARPIVLLNGRRVSSYRELRDIPIEAIQRVDIMPEEVALKYGYAPNQKVVNVVLRDNFKSTVGQIAGNTASREGNSGGSGDLTRLELGKNHRTTLNAHAGGDDILSRSQRMLVRQQYESTSSGQTGFVLPLEFRARAGATINRQLPGDLEATYNAEAEHSLGHSLGGLSEQLPAQLNRDTKVDSLHLGAVLNGGREQWHWSVTGDGDVEREDTSTTNAGALFAPGSARSFHADANLDGTINGDLFELPAGKAGMTLRVGGATEHLHIDQEHLGVPPSEDTNRTTGIGALSIDLPISRRGRSSRALGNFTVNANAEIDQLSDFGSLMRVGAGANWSPVQRLNFVASWSRQEDAPTVRQLGAAFVETPGTLIFDFTQGIVERAEVITGGNPMLRTERRNTLKLSAEWQPFDSVNFRLRADYAHMTFEHPISEITVSPQLEAAFPDRFTRDSAGHLLSVDLRPVNFRSARRDTLRLGFDFSKPLKSPRPTQAQVSRLIDKARAAGIAVPDVTAPASSAVPASAAPQFSTSGRIQFSLTDTITFSDRAFVGRGLPEIDYLHGAAIGQTGGQPLHQVQAQVGYFKSGIGGRLGFNWRSATRVDSPTGDTLHFSPLATFDLRLFANVGQDVAIVLHHPWLAGSSIRFEIGDLFNTQPRVRNAAGTVPIGYSPSMLDPLGRTFMLSFRKQFLPMSYYREQLQRFEQRQAEQPQTR